MNTFAKDTAVFVPIATPVFRDNFLLNSNEFSVMIKPSISLSVWGSEDHCGTPHMPCILFLFPPPVAYLCIS